MKKWHGFDSQNLKELIEKSRLNYREIEDVVGIPKRSLSRYVNGNLEPNIKTAVLLAEYFDVSVDYIIGRTRLDVTGKARVMGLDGMRLEERLTLFGAFEAMKYRRDRVIIEIVEMLEQANEICEMLDRKQKDDEEDC
ncbi:helix-turn-helix transcriptional regulator [Candidatus Saccharibacteria bacterium]|nr:helix-turn-helix transcriptional regulator [Candidatus Saccharibacteria bacterium]